MFYQLHDACIVNGLGGVPVDGPRICFDDEECDVDTPYPFPSPCDSAVDVTFYVCKKTETDDVIQPNYAQFVVCHFTYIGHLIYTVECIYISH